MRYSWHSYLRALALAFSLTCSTAVHAATRVALVSTCGGTAGDDVLALTEGELSADPNIDLVERTEVQRVLTEQQLMACGLGEANQATAIGRILGADVFATLETIPNEKEALGLVVFDGATGIKLWNSVLPTGNVEKTAEAIAAAVQMACQKRRQGNGCPTTVCILSVRNADLPREFDSLCESVGLLLDRRLLEVASLAVLDRKHLEYVNKERSLIPNSPSACLLASLVLVDLQISRGDHADEIRATAVLRDNNDKLLGNAVALAFGQNAADLAESLVQQIARTLQVKPPTGRADRIQEAQQFLREAKFLNGNVGLAAALPAAEAAMALDPHNRAVRSALIDFLGEEASSELTGPHSPASGGVRNQTTEYLADALQRALDLATRAVELSFKNEQDPPVEIHRNDEGDLPDSIAGVNFWRNGSVLLQQADDADLRQKASDLRRLEMDFLRQHAGLWLAPEKPIWASTYTLESTLERIEYLSSDHETWAQAAADLYPRWFCLLEQENLWVDWTRSLPKMMLRLCLHAQGTVRSEIPGVSHGKREAADANRLRLLFEEMERHCDPVVQAYGMIGALALDAHEQKLSPVQIDQRYQAIKAFLQQQVIEPTREPVSVYRGCAYGAGLDLADLFVEDQQARRREYLDWFHFMLQHKQFAYWVVMYVTEPNGATFRQYGWYQANFIPVKSNGWTTNDYTELVANADAALRMYHAKDCVDVDGRWWSLQMDSVDWEWAKVQEPIYEARPDLAPSPSPPPWSNALLLYDVSRDGGMRRIEFTLVQDGMAYAIGTTGDGLARVMRVPLEGGVPELLPSLQPCKSDIKAVVLEGDWFYVATAYDGILMLSRDGRQSNAITHLNGLPSDDVESLAWLDGKLYAGLGGGYLIAYDVKTKQCNVLISSRRKDAGNPFEDYPEPLGVPGMLSDPARHRILFLAALPNAECESLQGLWQIGAGTNGISQLLAFNREPHWMRFTQDGQVLIHFWRFSDMGNICQAPATGIISFDAQTNRGRLAYAWINVNKPTDIPADMGPQLPGTGATIGVPMSMSPPALIVNGWLWYKSARISPDGKKLVKFPILTRQGARYSPDWNSFEAVGDNDHILAADNSTVWLLTVPKD